MQEQNFCKGFMKNVVILSSFQCPMTLCTLKEGVDGQRHIFLLSKKENSLKRRSKHILAIKFLKGTDHKVKSLHLYFQK